MKKTVLTRSFALLLALIMAFALVAYAAPAASAAEEEGVVIKLHYHRPDGDYTDWSVWFWNLGAEGSDIPFAEEDGDMVATFQVDPGVTSVGFIVKLPNWASKDVSEDQFIDVAAYLSGTVHVYVESGVKGYEIVLGDDVVSGIKLTGAVYKDGQGVQVTMTASIGKADDKFVINGPDGPVAIASVTEDKAGVYTIVTEQPLDLYASYTLTYEEEEYKINMPNVYSTESFENAYTYEGKDLGATWTAEKTSFRLWAPTASKVVINLYESGTPGTDDLKEQIEMTPDVNGTWVAEKAGDLNGVYYTYSVTVDGKTNEACDPYARATGVNGKRAMVIDLDSTNPDGWDKDSNPNAGINITDAIIYELHVRDLSIDASSGVSEANRGKYLGLIQAGTTNSNGVPTGLDHMVNLGITHLHLLPVYDYGSVDETKLDQPQFNWGYDPVNYNVPEGSYSSDPYHGEVRVAEFKEMVMGLHDAGISVVMDVVYNHVYSASDFCFNLVVPGYFSRITEGGSYSNGSGCGNDTASERSMVKKYIVDSVLYWAEEYHVDGFRFDLVGLIDTETINEVVAAVHAVNPDVIFYGEGWTMSTAVTKDGYTMTTQVNSAETPKFAFFSDTIRDMIKGSVFNETDKGYVSGAQGFAPKVSASFMGLPNWSDSPTQVVNYASCHDNFTLYDKLVASASGATEEELVKMNNLAAAIYMTSQGIPFLQAGEEMLRTKDGDHNSYASSDAINSLKWDTLNSETYQAVYEYYKGLIAFRKAHPGLRMTDAEEVKSTISAITGLSGNVTAFRIAAGANGEESDLFVIFNPDKEAATITLPEGSWTVCINDQAAGTEALASAKGEVSVPAISAMVLVLDNTDDGDTQPGGDTPSDEPTDDPAKDSSFHLGSFLAGTAVGAVVVAIVAAIIAFFTKKRKN